MWSSSPFQYLCSTMTYQAVALSPVPAPLEPYRPALREISELSFSPGEALDSKFEDRLHQAVAQADRTGETIAVHLLAMTAPSNRQLLVLANRISTLTRGCDASAYLGDGRFAVLQRAVPSFDGVLALAHKLLAAAAAPVAVAGKDLPFPARIGLSLHSPGVGPAQLLERAERASLQARDKGSSLACFENRAEDRLPSMVLHNRLLRALERNELFVVFQPQVDLSSGQPLAFEALVRWQDPHRGVVGPDQFIPFAEKTGLIVELGRWVLEESCRRCAKWNSSAPKEVPVAVNLSAVQLRDPRFPEELSRILEKTNLRPELLELELTETVSVDETAIATLRKLREMGVRLAIDDFGTGYCTFQYLNLVPFTKVKIPAQLVQSSAPGSIQASAVSPIVDAVATIGHRLGLEIVAEGVETPEQLQAVRAARCTAGQGYLLGRPTPKPRLPEPA